VRVLTLHISVLVAHDGHAGRGVVAVPIIVVSLLARQLENLCQVGPPGGPRQPSCPPSGPGCSLTLQLALFLLDVLPPRVGHGALERRLHLGVRVHLLHRLDHRFGCHLHLVVLRGLLRKPDSEGACEAIHMSLENC
jgi:hypothetical protein